DRAPYEFLANLISIGASSFKRGLSVDVGKFGISPVISEREIDCENRALARPGTFGADTATMQFHQMAYHCQTQTEPARLTRNRAFLLTEPMENVREKVWCYSIACVADRQTNIRGGRHRGVGRRKGSILRVQAFETKTHAATTRRKLDSIHEQVPN